MPSDSTGDFPARGKVIRVVDDNAVIFAPSNTTYELKLVTASKYDGPVGSLIDAIIRGNARKCWTVASGGNFITPIHGPPRIVPRVVPRPALVFVPRCCRMTQSLESTRGQSSSAISGAMI